MKRLKAIQSIARRAVDPALSMNPVVQTLIRAVLKVGGGYLVERGLANNNDAEAITAGIMAAIGVVWGILHRQQQQKAYNCVPHHPDEMYST
jgi:hypothetical protein